MRGNLCKCQLCADNNCLCSSYAKFFSILGNNNRLHIMNSLCDGEKNVTEIMTVTGLEQTCVSHCLRMLQKHDFVSSKKQGRYKVYSLNKQAIEPLMKLIDSHVKKKFVGGTK